jgi:SAM-dependent methyltransferase
LTLFRLLKNDILLK